MFDTKIDKLIRATKEDRFNAYRFLILAAGFEDEAKLQCGRNQHDTRHEFCCAEWAYMRAWVLWAAEDEEHREFTAVKNESGEIHFKEETGNEEEADELAVKDRFLPPAIELGRIRGWESKERLAAARLEELDNPGNRPVIEIIEELGRLGHPDSVGPLLVQFTLPTNDVKIRAAAARALAAIGDPIAIPTFIRHVSTSGATRTTLDMVLKTSLFDLLSGSQEEQEVYLLAAVIETLGIFGDPKAVRPLRHAMQSQYTAIREATATALGRIGSEEAEQALARRTGDRKTRVVRAAQKALSSLEDTAVHSSMILAEFLKDPTRSLEKTAHALLECGSQAVSMLLEIMPGAEGELRDLGSRVLSNISDPPALEEMIFALEDPDASVRILVSEALANNPHRPGRAVAALKQLRENDPDEKVREAADSAIEKIMKGLF
ncbi:MAG: HEAT repeat domain-containing protein [Planctomycetota bacterium]|jgi:HEAT repeat protein